MTDFGVESMNPSYISARVNILGSRGKEWLYCRIRGFATEYSTSVRKFTAT
jgi:hypothetical protein